MDTYKDEVDNTETTGTQSLGDMLLETGMVTQKQLDHALQLQQEQEKKLSEVLIEQNLITPQNLAAVLSIQMNLPLIDLRRHTIQPEALKLIPERVARKHTIVPLDIVGDSLVVVMADPGDIQTINDLVAQSGVTIEPAIGTPSDIQEAIDLNYKVVSEIEKELSRLITKDTKQEEEEAQFSLGIVEETPIVKIADLLIDEGIRERASDIHLEPQRDRLRIRYRIDGMLHDVMALPLSTSAALASRVKIMANMNIAERRLPQDGQFSIVVDGRSVDIRVATSQTAYGEYIVMRILDKSRFVLELSELGFLSESLTRYRQMLKNPFGLILVAGPTGSGKTTTLYASVNELDRQGRNIITVEDPVEYLFDDINQIQVNTKAGMTFASGLRAIMRLDPDVILIGEMRDNETANIGVQAALTGHLVLSSIHGNDAAGVLFRLENLGLEPFLISTALIGVVSQRMVRRVCPHCSTMSERPVEEQIAYENQLGELRKSFYTGTGCNFCANTGYLGRTGVHEILLMSDEIRQMVVRGATTPEIREQAIKDGMIPMIRDGMLKVKEGITTPGEVMYNVFSID